MGAAYVNEAVDFLTSYPGIAYAVFIVMMIVFCGAIVRIERKDGR